MGIIYLKYLQERITGSIIDNKINKFINFFIENNAQIIINKELVTLICNKNQQNYSLEILKNEYKIEYVYKEKNYEEKTTHYSTKTKYIKKTQQTNKKTNIKKIIISVFDKELNEIFKCKRINQDIFSETYIKTKNNIIFLIKRFQEKEIYYISYIEEYEQYIPEHIIFKEIESQDYHRFFKHEIEDNEILQKYFGTAKK